MYKRGASDSNNVGSEKRIKIANTRIVGVAIEQKTFFARSVNLKEGIQLADFYLEVSKIWKVPIELINGQILFNNGEPVVESNFHTLNRDHTVVKLRLSNEGLKILLKNNPELKEHKETNISAQSILLPKLEDIIEWKSSNQSYTTIIKSAQELSIFVPEAKITISFLSRPPDNQSIVMSQMYQKCYFPCKVINRFMDKRNPSFKISFSDTNHDILKILDGTFHYFPFQCGLIMEWSEFYAFEIVVMRNQSIIYGYLFPKGFFRRAIDEEYISLMKNWKIPLILDIDDTLVRAVGPNPNYQVLLNDLKFYEKSRIVNLESGPIVLSTGVKDFLKEVNKFYQLYVCSNGTADYIHEVVEALDPRKDYILRKNVFSNRDNVERHQNPLFRVKNLQEILGFCTKPNSLFPCPDNAILQLPIILGNTICKQKTDWIDDRSDAWHPNQRPNVIKMPQELPPGWIQIQTDDVEVQYFCESTGRKQTQRPTVPWTTPLSTALTTLKRLWKDFKNKNPVPCEKITKSPQHILENMKDDFLMITADSPRSPTRGDE